MQENIIIHLCKGVEQGKVTVSTSHDASFADYQETRFDFAAIVKLDDAERFIHIPTSLHETDIPAICTHTLQTIGLEVCTGPVVDFRLKECWSEQLAANTAPLLYPYHFSTGELVWPKQHKKKPNALHLTPTSRKWLMPKGHYVLVKRFSSKEERRRVVAYHLTPDMLDSELIGFENHWNIFHIGKAGLDATLASGLATFLNSTVLDDWFRVFSGHTQVNATDLRTLRYPSQAQLLELGKLAANCATLDQTTIDQLLASFRAVYNVRGFSSCPNNPNT
ncbi:MAG: hypothetical protein KJ914_02830 [Gammaproteobacteria bacterium]|nr:hypothetical protein [Gammaproteobacteria bacterium]MBU1725619.1 hypothetical protein [Gammaproteobacteria bacterium]MBU2004029.1 hypothetical protein [Gammaproteobacteria bacterium]